MKKLFTLSACALFAGVLVAGDWFPVKVIQPATNVVTVYNAAIFTK